MYTCNFNNNIVEKYTTSGTAISNIEGHSSSFAQPDGIAVDYDGYIYVGDAGNSRMQKFDSDGNWICTIDSLSRPTAIALDNNGILYILESNGPQVSKFYPGP